MEDHSELNTPIPSSEVLNNTANFSLPTKPSSFPVQTHGKAFSRHNETDHHLTDGTIPLPELKAMLQQQLEYYFSRENLATDTYLLSQMDSDQYVPIGFIANFNQIKRLTKDLNLIVSVLRESPFVQVDEAGEKVRPNHRSFVLILREVPEITPLKEIEELFASENCPKFIRCEFAHNNTWYVTFESDEDTQKAYRFLREEVKTFQGKPVMARIKARPLTNAPFIPAYKNGICQINDADVYSNQIQQQQQQQHNQQQQQQQNQFRYNYSNVHGDAYNNQQMCPPFYPPPMLQAWAPTSPACVDLGTVFSVNGLTPQSTFRPTGNTRHYGSRERQVKPFSPQNYTFVRQDQGSHFFNRGQSNSYLQRQHSFHNLNSGAYGFDYLPYVSSNSRSLHTFGMDMHNFFSTPNLYLRRLQGHQSLYPTSTSQPRHNSFLWSHNQVGLTDLNTQEQSYLTMGATMLPFGKDSMLAVANVGKQTIDLHGKDPWSQQRQKNRSWWKDSSGSSKTFEVNSSNYLYDNKILSGTEKQESPKFDLQTTSFPPLPGCLDNDNLEGEVFESRLSDIVKGTVKPSTRDNKTQTSDSSPDIVARAEKDGDSLAVEDNSAVTHEDLITAFTSPASPEIQETVPFQGESVPELKSSTDRIEENSADDTNKSLPEAILCISNETDNRISISNSALSSTDVSLCVSVVSDKVITTSPSPIPSPVPNVSTNVPSDTEIKSSSTLDKQLETSVHKNKPQEYLLSKSKCLESVGSKCKLVDAPKDKGCQPFFGGSNNNNSRKSSSTYSKKNSSIEAFSSNKNEASSNKILDIALPTKLPNTPSKEKTPLPKSKHLESSIAKVPENQIQVLPPVINGFTDGESSCEIEKTSRKLTYSEVALRAKDKVAKLAQELKEKERQEAIVRHLRQQELAAQSKQASSRASFRDFNRGRYNDQRFNREWRERKKSRITTLPTPGQ